MGRLLSIPLVTALAVLAVPAAASAASTDVSISASLKTLTVRAGSNSANNVLVSADVAGDKILVRDTASGVATNDAPCTTTSGVVSCPLGELTKIEVTLGNRDDRGTIDPSVPAKIPTSVNGGSGNDVLTGGPGPDSLSGSSNNDTLFGGPGGDTLRGGSSFDIVSYADHQLGVYVTIGGRSRLDGGAEDGPPGGADTVRPDVEAVIGTAAADYIVGDRDANSLIGGAGGDFLVGGPGGDYLAGQADSDFLVGNSGNDVLDGGPGADGLRGNRGFDRLFARDGERDSSLRCGPSRDRLFRDRIDPRGRSCKPHRHKRRRR